MPLVLEGVEQDSASGVPSLWICMPHILEQLALDLSVLLIPLHISDDLDGNLAVLTLVICHQHPAKSAIAQLLFYGIPGIQQQTPLP